jgi:aminobenzoyl-glutamate transport protein
MGNAEKSGNEKKSPVEKFLNIIERVGNALPHPVTLFASLALLVVILSAVASAFSLEVAHPKDQKIIKVINLLSEEGLHLILKNLVTNFTSFAPLGTVLVAILGIGIAESSGFIGTALRLLVLKAPVRLLTLIIVFSGVISNTASEVGYVLLIPLAGVIFQAAGRHPIAGMAAAFAGVSGGYSANLLLGTIDPLLAGISQEAARIIDPNYSVSPACNYYFMFASTFTISLAGSYITEKVVEPRLGKYESAEKAGSIEQLSAEDKKGLKTAVLALFTFFAVLTYLVLPRDLGLPLAGILRGAADETNPSGDLLHSPFMSGIVSLIFVSAAIGGIAYGIGAGTVKNDGDVVKGMSKAMESLGSYIVLVFFAAQFVAFFNQTNLGLVLAVKGAETLKSVNLGTYPLVFSFILVSAIINLVMGSASAKWAIMAPVFIPMFMLLGLTPEFTQVAYRIVAFFQRYDKNAGIGTIISTMLPYSFFFFVIWTAMLLIWIALGLPIGPNAAFFMPAK